MLVCAGDALLFLSEGALCSCMRLLNPNFVHLSAPPEEPDQDYGFAQTCLVRCIGEGPRIA